MTCDERRDLLLLYVSDALEADEAREMRNHLQTGCPACAGGVAEAEALLASLPLALDDYAPSPKVKANLMRRLDEQAATAGVHTDAGSESLPIRLFRYFVPTAIAAGLAIMATHAVMNQNMVTMRQEMQQLRDGEVEAAATKMLAVSEGQQLQLLQGKYESQAQLVTLLRSSELKLVPLTPSALQPGAVANLLWDQKQNQWAILTSGMTPPPAGQTYELWFVTKAGAKVSAGTFDVDKAGNGSLRVNIPDGIGALKLAAVTNEKIGGVSQPQGNFQVTGSVE